MERFSFPTCLFWSL